MTVSVRWAVTACAVVVGGVALVAWQSPAQSQVRVTPALQPVGAASGAATTAWFQDTTGGRVVACQTTGIGGTLAVTCASAALP